MLIKNAEIYQRGLGDLRLVEGSIAEIGTLSPETDEPVIDANGGALLPGLNDHHIHFLSYAAALVSMDCSPTAREPPAQTVGISPQEHRLQGEFHLMFGANEHAEDSSSLLCYPAFWVHV